MNFDNIISSMKLLDYDSAAGKSLLIYDTNFGCIGRLVPIGGWLLTCQNIIEVMTEWRKKFGRMFLTQFDPSHERTKSYLEKGAISDPCRIFFVIEDNTGATIGHIGLSAINPASYELDNLIRGQSGGHPSLIYYAEKALLKWAFTDLGISRCNVGVLSFNWLALELHKSIGFKEQSRIQLYKTCHEGTVSHKFVSGANQKSNVPYSYIRLSMTSQEFNDQKDNHQ